MRRSHTIERTEELNYWQSISDVMTALLLVILLVLMLFILYMTRVPDLELTDAAYDDHTNGEYDHEGIDDLTALYWIDRDEADQDGSGGNGGGEYSGTTDFQYFGVGDYEGESKAAVYVTVRDGETGLTIKEAGITFELFDSRSGKRTLSTYYPHHEQYVMFSTTEGGNFYLPEKIGFGRYSFKGVSVPYGYETAEEASFMVEETHDWNDPLNVIIDLFPCKNRIRIHNSDKASGESLAGAVYDIVAASDIVTADGTLRYRSGAVVGQILCDQWGNGESDELYLGQYVLKQTASPEYYASMDEEIKVTVDRKDKESTADTLELTLEKTTLSLSVRDEWTGAPLSGVSWEISGLVPEGTITVSTDINGTIHLEDIRQGATLTMNQTSWKDGYLAGTEPVTVSVDQSGRIGGEAASEITLSNRILRVTLGVKDVLLKHWISDKSMALNDENGECLQLWTTSALPLEISGLQPGIYTLVSGKTEYIIRIEDKAEPQTIAVTSWSITSILLISAVGLVVILVIGLCIRGICIQRKKKNERRKE